LVEAPVQLHTLHMPKSGPGDRVWFGHTWSWILQQCGHSCRPVDWSCTGADSSRRSSPSCSSSRCWSLSHRPVVMHSCVSCRMKLGIVSLSYDYSVTRSG